VEFFQRKEVKDILAYLRLVNNPPATTWRGFRAVAAPARGVGRTSLGRTGRPRDAGGLCLLDAAREAANIEKLGAKAVKALHQFVALIDQLGTVASEPIEAILATCWRSPDTAASSRSRTTPATRNRWPNVDELLTVAREYDERANSHRRLEEFLEEVTWSATPTTGDTEPDCVTLMTLHASKGLEFPSSSSLRWSRVCCRTSGARIARCSWKKRAG